MHDRDAQVLTPADRQTVTWNWVDAAACEVKSRSATPAEARAALYRGAKTETRMGQPMIVTRAGWFTVN